MTILGKILIAVVLSLANVAFAHSRSEAQVCANLLTSGTYKTVMRQAFELGVVTSADRQIPVEQLYLELKDAEFSTPDSAALRARLQEHRSKHFAIEKMSDKELAQFYQNSLHALYGRVASLWRTQEIRTQVGPVMKSEIEAALAQVLKQSFSPWALEDRDLTPQAAREHFSQRKWMPLPWQKMAIFVLAWETRAGAADPDAQKFDAREFGKFWDSQGERHQISFEIFQKLNLALNRNYELSVCCKSEPGCVTCPLNRRWRVQKEEPAP